jgi:trans-aconitate 2-methyltransferase
MSWNPEQYLRFAEPRLRPALDLLSRVDVADPKQVCDLGCGAGNVTAFIAQRWPTAEVTGIDSSAAMLAKARDALPGVRWQQADLKGWQPDRAYDLIYSNAALHWLPAHDTLFPSLIDSLAPGGVLAVQMPKNFDAPSHTAIADTVNAGPWRDRLAPLVKPAPVAEPETYFEILRTHADAIDIWQTRYLQVLQGKDPVKEWTKGTWLRQFLDALPPTEAAAFEADYAERMRKAYPALADRRTLFPFRRLFIVARRED